MKALILDTQVCQIEAVGFPVAPPLVWVDCSDDITTQHTYVDGVFIIPSIFEPEVIALPTAAELMAQLSIIQEQLKALQGVA
jgi:hypothetical protein